MFKNVKRYFNLIIKTITTTIRTNEEVAEEESEKVIRLLSVNDLDIFLNNLDDKENPEKLEELVFKKT